jgi:hypothetical protein
VDPLDNQGGKNNRNRFAKKKLPTPAALRSQSVDLKECLANFHPELLHQHQPQAITATKHVSPPVVATNSSSVVPSLARPNLTRQNALAKTNPLTTKSLTENLNTAHHHHHHHIGHLQQLYEPLKPPKSNRIVLATTSKHQNKHGRKHHHHHHHHHTTLSNRRKRMLDRSSSLTDSSSSSESSDEMSSDERHAHSDSFLSSSPDTSLDDLAQLNNLDDDMVAAVATAVSGPGGAAAVGKILLPHQNKLKKRTPVFNIFEKVNNNGNNSGNTKNNRQQAGQSRRHALNKHSFYSSDDSVCGIPKPTNKLANTRYVM